MSLRTTLITFAILTIFFFWVGPDLKQKYWPDEKPLPAQPWIDPSLAPVSPSPAQKQAEGVPTPEVPPVQPANPTSGKWIKMPDTQDRNGRITEKWSFDGNSPTEPLSVKGWKMVSFHIKEPVMMGFKLPSGIVVWFSDNAINSTQYLEVSPGVLSTEKLPPEKYLELGKLAEQVLFRPLNGGKVSVEVTRWSP